MIADKTVIETFREVGSWELGNLKQSEPSCFNGCVRVVKYRVTVERVEEPDDVVRARIQALWDTCDNHHHRGPLRDMARTYGMSLSYGKGATA